jgi:hypothetical protein
MTPARTIAYHMTTNHRHRISEALVRDRDRPLVGKQLSDQAGGDVARSHL